GRCEGPRVASTLAPRARCADCTHRLSAREDNGRARGRAHGSLPASYRVGGHMDRLVSVLTPTFNGEAFVAETIDSVLSQTYEPIEHIVVDDGSTDGTRDVVAEYAVRDPDRVRLLAFDDRIGPTRRRNDALKAASGEYLAWLDHDDLWLPEKT